MEASVARYNERPTVSKNKRTGGNLNLKRETWLEALMREILLADGKHLLDLMDIRAASDGFLHALLHELEVDRLPKGLGRNHRARANLHNLMHDLHPRNTLMIIRKLPAHRLP